MSCTIIADSEVGFENRIIILFHGCISQLYFLTVFHGCFNDCISWLYLTGQHTKTNALQCGLHHSIHHHGPHRHCHILQGGLHYDHHHHRHHHHDDDHHHHHLRDSNLYITVNLKMRSLQNQDVRLSVTKAEERRLERVNFCTFVFF